MVLLCAFQLFNVQLLLLSGIGTTYEPLTGKGQVVRNFTHQTTSTAVSRVQVATFPKSNRR